MSTVGQHVHSLLEISPLTAALLLTALHWGPGRRIGRARPGRVRPAPQATPPAAAPTRHRCPVGSTATLTPANPAAAAAAAAQSSAAPSSQARRRNTRRAADRASANMGPHVEQGVRATL